MAPTTTLAPAPAVTDADWDLDVSVVQSGPVIAELLRATDDGCGSTCASACVSCR